MGASLNVPACTTPLLVLLQLGNPIRKLEARELEIQSLLFNFFEIKNQETKSVKEKTPKIIQIKP